MTATVTRLPTPRRLKTYVREDSCEPGIWRVEAVDYDAGGIAELTMFSGDRAKERAFAFAAWSYAVPRNGNSERVE